MSFHGTVHFVKDAILWKGLVFGVYFYASTFGNRFDNGTVNPCIGILKLSNLIDYALVPNQQFLYGTLTLIHHHVLQICLLLGCLFTLVCDKEHHAST